MSFQYMKCCELKRWLFQLLSSFSCNVMSKLKGIIDYPLPSPVFFNPVVYCSRISNLALYTAVFRDITPTPFPRKIFLASLPCPCTGCFFSSLINASLVVRAPCKLRTPSTAGGCLGALNTSLALSYPSFLTFTHFPFSHFQLPFSTFNYRCDLH